uniref:Mediator complex subunit Med12 domain-containing protein n=1 Tax=Timema cristinae TaxID=61476 RepID=A0A7R9H8K4_TIMCR|nr:unnamed protein product [Timema cristinae]
MLLIVESTMMGFSYEKRPLKRPRLGPPDVYPQEPKQKEDELTTINVKHGFATMPQLTDEFGTARNCNLTAVKVVEYFNQIMNKKEELNTLIPDTGRKRQQINPKDNFWPATARTKNAIEAWFKDLAGSKPLSSLSKKVPSLYSHSLLCSYFELLSMGELIGATLSSRAIMTHRLLTSTRRKEIFMMLCEYSVPMLRAAWFIKLSYAYTVAVSEVKIKKRQLPDPTQEWTATLIKFLKDQLNKLQDYYHMSSGSTPTRGQGASPAPNTTGAAMTEEQKLAHRHWQYCTRLAHFLYEEGLLDRQEFLYEEGLLDRQEFLQWLLDLLDKVRSNPADDGLLRPLLPLALQYVDEFVQSELLGRKFAYLCCKKLAQLCFSSDTAPSLLAASPQSPLVTASNNRIKFVVHIKHIHDLCSSCVPGVTPQVANFSEYLSCSHHRDIILGLSVILQYKVCQVLGATSNGTGGGDRIPTPDKLAPTYLVRLISRIPLWNSVGEGKTHSVLNGSPLDHLPCTPSTLPMPQRSNNHHIRRQLRSLEEHICQRSQAAEGRWSCDKWQQSSAGLTTNKVLTALEALDRHSFDRMDSNNCLDTLYSKIFTVPGNKDNGSAGASDTTREIRADFPINHDEAVVQTLCEWAVSHQRSGEHRAMAVSKLLEKRQGDLCAAVAGEGEGQDDKDSVCSGTGAPLGLPVFQNLLMKFLDNDAPVLDDNPSPQNRAMFTNLIHLFAELIRHDIFSHDVYMCTLISRGDLNTGGPTHKPATPGDSRTGVGNPSLQDEDGSLFPAKLEVQDHGRGMDYDDSKIDDDLDKLLQHIKEEQQNSMLSREGVVPQDAPDSPKDDGVPALVAPPIAAVPLEGPEPGNSGETRSRHLLYTTHFPLPQDEPYTMHDCNQRHVLLYGVGRVRDEARHTVKKMTKEVCKLFGKKFSIDVAEVDPSRKGYDSTKTPLHCQYWTSLRAEVYMNWMHSVGSVWKLKELLFGAHFKACGVLEHFLETCYPLPLSPSIGSRA